MSKVSIRILGIFSESLLPKFKNVFSIADISDNAIVLFCAFSDFDVPIGHVFSGIENDQGKEVFRGPIVLKKVTQQWSEPYDLIPHGHKTICKFEFIGSTIPNIVKDLPVVRGWYESKQYVDLVG